MATESENTLNKDCNLIKRGTHVVFRRPEDEALFVIDTDLQFNFRDGRALTQAQDTAREANEATDGCANCPLYGQCLPTPSVISNPVEHKLISAQRTSFD